MARKRVDPKAKQRKQVIILVVGLVLLGGVMAFQLPKLMKSPSPAPAAAETSTALPAAADVEGAGTAKLVDAPAVPKPGEGQLVSFNLFESKDPFVQQVKTLEDEAAALPQPSTDPGPTVGAPELPPIPTSTPAPAVPTPSTPAPTEPAPATPSAPSAPSTPTPPAAPVSATISVNGTPEKVNVKGDFPAAEPLFTLISLTADTAEIAIAGGEYQDGAASVTLQKGKSVTLMNTADGARYELKLVSLG
jgi:hypothetical protein